MDYYAGIDVSLKDSSVCVMDAAGKIVREAKVSSKPEAVARWCQTDANLRGRSDGELGRECSAMQ